MKDLSLKTDKQLEKKLKQITDEIKKRNSYLPGDMIVHKYHSKGVFAGVKIVKEIDSDGSAILYKHEVEYQPGCYRKATLKEISEFLNK